MKKLLSILCIMLILIIPQMGCDTQAPNSNQGISKSSFHLDTVCSVTIYSMDESEGKSDEEAEEDALILITDSFKLCDKYEKILSKTAAGSDIYKINNAEGEWVEVQDCTVEVLEEGLKYGRLSEGVFDITIGDVSDMWNFHEQDETGNKIGTLPDEKQLAEAVKHVDYSCVEIDGNMVRLRDRDARLDLGGIAKGYIADRVAEYLENNGVTSAVVDLGGNIAVIGQKGKSIDDGQGTDFAIGVADPMSDRGELVGTISCSNKTVVTSGTYERYFEIDGVKYHHVLNPDTGYPVDTDLLSVTIIGDKGTSASCDGLSTTCLALGKEKAKQLIESIEDIGGILVDVSGDITVINADEFEEI